MDGRRSDSIRSALETFRIELPSWGFANTGTRFGKFLRQYHLTHHYASPDRHFGVSSPLWDVVFRTK